MQANRHNTKDQGKFELYHALRSLDLDVRPNEQFTLPTHELLRTDLTLYDRQKLVGVVVTRKSTQFDRYNRVERWENSRQGSRHAALKVPIFFYNGQDSPTEMAQQIYTGIRNYLIQQMKTSQSV